AGEGGARGDDSGGSDGRHQKWKWKPAPKPTVVRSSARPVAVPSLAVSVIVTGRCTVPDTAKKSSKKCSTRIARPRVTASEPVPNATVASRPISRCVQGAWYTV